MDTVEINKNKKLAGEDLTNNDLVVTRFELFDLLYKYSMRINQPRTSTEV